MDEWAAFLKARLDEDAEFLDDFTQPQAEHERRARGYPEHVGGFSPERLRREIAAHRAILALHECAAVELNDSPGDPKVFGWARAAEVAARDVAGIWDGHPDYPGAAKKSGHSS